MSDTTTPILNLIKPAVGASRDTWGTKWNSNADILDTQQGGTNGALTALQGRVTTLESEIGNYLPLSGGVITGTMSVQGNFYVTSGRLFSGPGASGDPCVCLWDSAQGFAVGWRGTAPDLLIASGMDGNGNAVVDLGWFDLAGNFTAKGSINSASAIVAGQATVATLVSTGGVDGATFYASNYIATAGLIQGSYITLSGTGVQYNYYSEPTLHAQWLDSGTALFPAMNGNYGPLGWYQLTGSDVRMKRDIRACGDALADLAQFNVVAFDKAGVGGVWSAHAYGLIADEVEQHAPDVAPRPSRPDVMRGLDLLPLMARCVRAIQQLLARVEQLESRRV